MFDGSQDEFTILRGKNIVMESMGKGHVDLFFPHSCENSWKTPLENIEYCERNQHNIIGLRLCHSVGIT